MLKKLAFALILVSSLILAACTSPQNSPAPETDTPAMTDVRLSMGFIPDVQFAPFYVGIEKGFFSNHGINLTMEHRQETDGAKLVATGEIDFAVISGEQVLLGREQELPLVYVFEWYQRFPVAVATKPDSGIREVADLAGRSVGVPMKEGASYIGLEALLFSAGMTDADIDLQTTGFAQVETLLADRADAVVVYVANEPVQMEQQGLEPTLIIVDEHASLVSNGLVSSEAAIANKPDLVRAMVAALAQSVQYSMDHPEEALEISKGYVEGLDSPDVAPRAQEILNRSIRLWQDDAGQIGVTEPASWVAMQEILLQMGLLNEEQDLSSAYTNDFLP